MRRFVGLAAVLLLAFGVVGGAAPVDFFREPLPALAVHGRSITALAAQGKFILPGEVSVRLMNRQTWKCASYGRRHALLLQYDCDDDPRRNWFIGNWGPTSGEVWIKDELNGPCITDAGPYASGNNVQLHATGCNGAYEKSQAWKLVYEATSDSWQIVNRHWKCLTVEGGYSGENDVSLVQYDCDSHPSRFWYIFVV